MMLNNIIKGYNCVKIMALNLFGILLVFTTATGSAYTSINIQLFQIAGAQLADNNNSNNNADVSLVSQREYSDAYSFHIVGEVQNTGTVSAEFVEIVASFYDGNGQFVGTSFTYTNPTTVSPGMKAPFDIQLAADDKIVKESKNYQLTLSWSNQDGKEMVKQYNSADLRQGQLQGQQQQQSSSPIGSSNTLSQTTEATTTTTTDTSFAAKALQFLTYCNNQLSQTPVNSMTTDTLVFCTMVYDWYYMGCNNNNAILAPIIAAQCKDPIIIQQVNNYKTQIDIRIKQIVKIKVRPPGDGGGDGNETGKGNDTEPIFDTCMGGPPGIDGCPPEDGRNETTSLLPIILPPDPCIENPDAEGCPTSPEDLCKNDPTAKGCEPAPDPCIENPNAEGCQTQEPIPKLGLLPDDGTAPLADNDDTIPSIDTDNGDKNADDDDDGGGDNGDSGDSGDNEDGGDDGGDAAKPS